MSWTDWLIVAGLGAWFALSCLHQFRRGALVPALIRRADIFHFLPIWTFFAPNPGSTDVRLFFRDHGPSGPGPWRQVFRDEPLALRALWNPDKRVRKAVSDAVAAIEARRRAGAPLRSLLLDANYLLLLLHVSAIPLGLETTSRQIAIGRSVGGDPDTLRLSFVSPVHRLEDA